MWLKIIMILISLFIIYHLFYDMKIWSNGGPLIEEMSTASSGGEEETLGLTEEEVRELIPAAAGAAFAAGLNEIIDAHMPEESKKTQDLTVISQDLGQKEQSELTNTTDSEISATVS